ncbi:MAG: hypothetical protein ABGW87_01690 [Sphingomonadaceae bacterium]
MTPERFTRFIAIDWSGAVGERHRGIAVAEAEAGGGAPRLIRPGHRWSRLEVLDVLDALEGDVLVGMDLGISLPFVDCRAFFPGLSSSPPDARSLWALIDAICADDPHLGANSFIDHPDFAPYFRRHGGREGVQFRCDNASHGRGRFRVAEKAQAAMGCKPYSNFNLVGAAQVGKSSLTGMRLLHQLRSAVPVWPIDPLPNAGPVVTEIYTTLAALEAGRSAARAKMRDAASLNHALTQLDSPPVDWNGPLDDHRADALLTAAWLRRAASRRELWQPAGLTTEIAQTEGWTFGAA